MLHSLFCFLVWPYRSSQQFFVPLWVKQVPKRNIFHQVANLVCSCAILASPRKITCSVKLSIIATFFQLSPCFCSPSSNIRELKQRRRGRQRERQKSNKFGSVKQQLCSCITFFCTFLSRHGTTTTRTFLISRFVEDVITRQQLPFSFPIFDTVF